MESFNKYPLERKWVIWEMWNTKDTTNYGKNMQSVGEFSDLWSFWQHWANLPHSDPKFFFTDTAKNEEKVPIDVPGPIESIGVFEAGVNPAWEDKENRDGCDFFCRLSSELDMKNIWQKIVFSLIGETFPNPETVTGVRIVDRIKIFKVEVWVRFNNDPEKIAVMKQKLKELLEFERLENIEVTQHNEKYNKVSG